MPVFLVLAVARDLKRFVRYFGAGEQNIDNLH